MAVLSEAMVELGLTGDRFEAELTAELNAAAERAAAAFGATMETEFERIAQQVAETFGAELDVEFEKIAESSSAVLGESLLSELEVQMEEVAAGAGDALAEGLSLAAEEAGTEAGIAAGDAMKESMAVAGREAGEAAAAGMAESGGLFSSVGDKLGELSKKGMEAAKLGFIGLGVAAIDSGLKQASAMQNATASFETLYHEGVGPATQQLMNLQNFANTTPFQFSQLQPLASQLASVGVTAQGSIQDLTALGDAAIATGRGANGINHSVRALQTMAQVGHATAGTIRELETGGVPALEALAAYTGQSMAQVTKALSKGQISYQQVQGAITSFAGPLGNFQGLIQKHAETLSGLFSTLKDSVQTDLKDAFLPFIPEFTAVIGQMTPLIASAVAVIGPAVAQLASGLFSIAGPAVQAIAGIVAPLFTQLGAAIKILVPSIAPLGAALGNMASAIAPLLPLAAQLIGVLAAGIGPIISAVAGALQPFIKALTTALAPVLPVLTKFMVLLGTAIGGILGDAIRLLIPLLGPVAKILTAVLQVLIPLLGPIGELADALASALGSALSAAMPLLNALAAVFLDVLKAVEPVVPIFVNALAPILPQLVQAFSQLVPPLLPLVQSLGQLVVTLAPLISLLARFEAFMLKIDVKIFSVEMTVLAKVLGVVAHVLVDVVHWVTNIVGLFTKTNWRKIADDIGAAFTAVVGWFEHLPGEILHALESLGSDIAKLFSTAFSAIGRAVVAGADAVVSEFKKLPGQAVHALADLGLLLIEAIKLAFEGLFIAIGVAIGSVIYLFTIFPGQAVRAVERLGPDLVQWAKDAWDAVSNAFVVAGTAVVNWVAALPGRVIAAVSHFIGDLGQWASEAWNAAYSFTVSIGSKVINWFEALPGRLLGLIRPLPGLVAGFFSQMWNDATSAVSTGVDKVVGFIRGLPGKLSAFGKDLLSVGSTLIQDLLKGLEAVGDFAKQLGNDIWNAFKGGVNAGVGFINKGIHLIPGLSNVNIPFLASGALVTRPTIAMIGEAGNEAVIPMSSPDTALSVATSTGLLSMLNAASGGFLGSANSGPQKVVNAPITVVTPAQDPAVVAATVLANLVRVVEVYDGYLSIGLPGSEQTIVDNALTTAIAQSWGFNVLSKPGCPNVSYHFTPSGDPDITSAPWYDPTVPASAEFAGFLGLQIGGTGKFPGIRNPLKVNSAGAVLGRIQQSYREIVVNAYAVASSERGLSYGMAWLTGNLRGTCLPSSGCGVGMAATMWTDCDLTDTTGRRQLYNVGLLQGPEQTSKANPRQYSQNCEGRAFWGGDVVFTLAAGWPWMYQDPVSIAPSLPFVVPIFWPCNATWVPSGTVGSTAPDCTDSPLAHCVQWEPVTSSTCTSSCPGTLDGGCLDDPLCPAKTAPPTVPIAGDPCVCLVTVQPLVATARSDAGVMPAFAELVPVIQVTAGNADMRRLLISFYSSGSADTCNYNQLDPCSMTGQLGIPYLPAGSTLTMDGRTQSALVTCADGTQAEPVLYSSAGPAVTWPVLSCSSAWCIAATVDESFVDPVNAALGISLVARQDAG